MNIFDRILQRIKCFLIGDELSVSQRLAALRQEVTALETRLRKDMGAELQRIGQWGSQIEERLTALETSKPESDLASRITALELELRLASTPTTSRNGSRMDMTKHSFGNRVQL